MEDFPNEFWFLECPLIIEVRSQSLILEQELIGALENLKGKGDADILIVKTGMCHIRYIH